MIIEITSDENRIYDNMENYEFIPDDYVLGTWQVVNYVDNIEAFAPENMALNFNYWQYIEFIDGGEVIIKFADTLNVTQKWTKGYILFTNEEFVLNGIIPSYTIKNINGADYLFAEWKSGDYFMYGNTPKYYVFKRGGPEIKYYYLGHTSYINETWNRTALADISKISKGEPVIALRESAADMSWKIFDDSSLSAKKDDIWGYDMRSCDVSQLDLSVIQSCNDITFDTDTKFPDNPDKLPADFDAGYILEFNKNPGLGIRELHKQGITGKGVSIAVIDQNLLTSHEQYKDNTPQEFITVINGTSVSAEIERNEQTYNFGKIVNPAEVIKILQEQ